MNCNRLIILAAGRATRMKASADMPGLPDAWKADAAVRPKPLVRSWTQLIEGHDAAPVRSTGRMGSSVDNAGTWYLEMEIYANASDLGVQPGAAPTDEQMSGMVAQVDSSVFRLERLEEQQARQAVSLERMEALLTRIGDRVGANRQRRAVGAKQERRSHLEA